MTPAPPSDRSSGWILAGLLLVHLLILRDSSPLILVACILLAVGAALRSRQIFAPAWLERGVFLLGLLAVFLQRHGTEPALLIGELAGLSGAAFLLRPVTPGRGLRVAFCILILLVACVVRRYSGLSATFIVLDVVVLMVVAQQIYRPPEAARSFWASLIRSLRVVVPVSIVVILVFWLFPDYSLNPMPAITGFAGSEVLNPGRVAQLSQSRRVAMVARFDEAEEVPEPSRLYWRGQVLEHSDGLRWLRDPGRKEFIPESLRGTLPRDVPVWRYRQDLSASRSGIIPVLDRAVRVDGWRGGQEIAVLNRGGLVLDAVGAGELRLEVTAAGDSAADQPERSIAEGCLRLPKKVSGNATLRALADEIFAGTSDVPSAARSLAGYLMKNRFAYTLRPGPVDDLEKFLLTTRRGFCEHYAAAAANVFRLGGFPARVVVGYRGGNWNPWLRAITVRDSDAHAWVEVWDEAARSWTRFDPTNFVAPGLSEDMEREFDARTWPWYRRASAAVTAFFTTVGERISEWIALVGTSEIWEELQPVFFVGLLLILTAWLVRRIVLRWLRASHNLAAALLENLEERASRRGDARRRGETPLAWLHRLGASASEEERQTLERFASAYARRVYGDHNDAELTETLRAASRRLSRLWRVRRNGKSDISR